jgi:hypothetical protein
MERLVTIMALLALFLSGCNKKTNSYNEAVLGLDYYPLTLGKYVVYDVDSVIYTELPKDTVVYKYRIKEKFTDTYTDSKGETLYRIERYIKNFNPNQSYDNMPWTIKEVWMMDADQQRVQVQEANIRYTKLIFPVEEKASWNGNASNSTGEWNYVYDYIDRTETINTVKLDKVLMVKQKEFRTAIGYQHYYEKYAKGIGLVHREMMDLVSQNIIAGVPVEGRIGSGFTYKQTLVTYGFE